MLIWSLVLGGFVLPILIILLGALYLHRYDIRTNYKAWRFPPSATTQGRANKYVLLGYRVVVFVFSAFVLVYGLIGGDLSVSASRSGHAYGDELPRGVKRAGRLVN
jgi:hypothetical protein